MAAKQQSAIAGEIGVSLDDLITGETEVKVAFGERALTVWYDPRKMTAKHLRALAKAPEGEEAAYAGARSVVELVTDWDLTRDGHPWPLTVEDVAAVPFKILNRIMKALAEDQGVDPT